MIIWGSKSREIVESEDTFFCPECQKESSYQLKRMGQYFTLYFIPLFQTKELGKFIECKQCKGQFKQEVLNYSPQPSLSNSENENEESQFSSAAEMVQMQMMSATILYEEQLKNMTQEQEKLYLAFELGVIEYFDRKYLSISEVEDSDVRFINFLIYLANQKYGDNSEAVFQMWKSFATNGLMHNERKFGFDSVNNQVNPDGTKNEGHFPGKYLKDAVGI